MEELRKIVDKQVNYIIQEIPEVKIQQLMENAVATNTITKLSSTHFRIETNLSQYAEMEIKFPFIRIITDQCNHLEWAFFNLLRSFNGRLLAVNLEEEHVGWIKPLKIKAFV